MFKKFFGMNNKIKEREIIEAKTTLEIYKTFFVSQEAQKYQNKNCKYKPKNEYSTYAVKTL
jgi:hypothetical protein